MKGFPLLVIAALFISSAHAAPEDTLQKYMMFVFGSPEISAESILHDNPDNWMIPGKYNPSAIERLKRYSFRVSDPGTFAGVASKTLFFVQIRDGKVDPAYPLQGAYSIHKNLIRQFFYYSILQRKRTLSKLVTNVDNIDFGGAPAAAYGDMGVYNTILARLPAIRTSTPEHDKTTKTVSYRVPLGDNGFELTLVKSESGWKIDSSDKIKVPLEFFFRRSRYKSG